VRSDTINALDDIMAKLRYVLASPADAQHYRLVVRRERRPPPPPGTDRTHVLTLRFVCLRASVAMSALTRGHRATIAGEQRHFRPARYHSGCAQAEGRLLQVVSRFPLDLSRGSGRKPLA
jgi:hypothetical protein